MKKYYWIIGIAILIILGVFVYEIHFLSSPYDEIANIQIEKDSKEEEKAIPEQSQKVSLIAVGDIMLSRVVGSKIRKYGDYNYPFLKTASLLKEADITFGNLETAITPGREILTGEMIFRADPEVTQGLNYAGFDVLSLANNHTQNFGQKGLKDTFYYYKKNHPL